jgi:AcrR family transcriptional regulator
VGESAPDELRRLVLDGAAAELQHWGPERFSFESLAAEIGVDVGQIKQYWPNENAVILDMLSHYGAAQIDVPDLGSLREDFRAYAGLIADYVETPMGRKLLRSMVITGDEWQISDRRSAFWTARLERLSVMGSRAAERGELRDDVDPKDAILFLVSPIYLRVLYTQDPISREFCETVAETAWRAIKSD